MNHLFRIDCGLTRTTQLYGSFELATDGKGRNLRANTPVGFYDVDGGRQYWQLTNRLGSVMALVDSDGNVQRRSGHYPGGIPFVLDGEDSHVPDPCKPDDRHHIGNRWVSFGGLDWYDNTARMHNPLLMRFTTPDPLARDFTHLSPWSHCAANPANNIDPDGKDIVVLSYGTGRNQHLAMLIQNEDGKWQYYSINGNNMYIPFTDIHIGGREFNDVAVGSWDSPQEFLNSSYNVENDNSKNDPSMNNYGFTEGYQIKTTPEQDYIMRNSFCKSAKSTYNLITNNCAHAVQQAMVDAGIPVSKPTKEPLYIPVSTPYGLVNVLNGYKIKCDLNRIPSSAFKSIMEWNPHGTYLHK